MKTILIVEDELTIAELIRDYLELNGFRCVLVASGHKALDMVKQQQEHYDLILLDVMLPGLDGFQLCQQLREGLSLDIPIIMVTARQEDIDKMKGFDRGADDYIVKPFNPNELVARVKAHLSRYDRLVQRRTEQVLQIGGLTIEVGARRVQLHGEERFLTLKEFDLLVFMAQHPNQVFSKEHLFERVWGYDALGDASTVTVHVRKLREKIEADPSNPLWIETIWGVGYRFRKD
ncbi:DNA-binding response regulator [Paenibacillus montaniterrae]|uniref:DNA-binding response regulator n=1 Tax=Paenibacillus montaniterrae TaxID=429341 RepID=A0A920CYW7_9BACL|nr:response regulator transcription factor [Paenibacillus montaniterrae]GIP17840.1 DNA-binding response regulator [Paenibacillus montaniterrae]